MRNLTYFSAIFLLCNLDNVLTVNTYCASFDALLTQNIENQGFHRDLKWLLEVTHPDSALLMQNECSFAMKLEMPQGVFVNPDQLADLQRLGMLKTFISDSVDVELIEHEAMNHTVYVFIETDEFTKVSISLPFHVRYQRSQLSGGYGKVILPKPSLLVRCSKSKENVCNESVMFAPCNCTGLEECRWLNINYNPLFEVDEVLVPVGDLDHYPLVSIVSLSIGCIGCIYILSLLSVFSRKAI